MSTARENWFWHGFRDRPRRGAAGPIVDHDRSVLIMIWFGFCGRI